jgi:hypothetical protein
MLQDYGAGGPEAAVGAAVEPGEWLGVPMLATREPDPREGRER